MYYSIQANLLTMLLQYGISDTNQVSGRTVNCWIFWWVLWCNGWVIYSNNDDIIQDTLYLVTLL